MQPQEKVRENSRQSKRIEKLLRRLFLEIGENPDREGLKGTPARMVEMYKEIFAGYRMNAELDVGFTDTTDVIIAKDIQFYSMCEHHMLPFFGKIHIAYIPDGKVFGISKLARLVEKYSRRMQIQERLTEEIAEEINKSGVRGILVIVEAQHLCMKMRGVKSGSTTMTVAHKGVMERKELREHVFSLLYSSKPELRSI
jgi:GTP cyclohydrolase I